MICWAPISAHSCRVSSSSEAGNVADTAVTAAARFPKIVCATFRTSVLSMPPENATSAEFMPWKTSCRRFSAAVISALLFSKDQLRVDLGLGLFGDHDQRID